MDLGYYAPLGAEALLTGVALLVVLLGLFVKNKNLGGYLSLIGLGIAMWMVASAKLGTTFFFDTMYVDGFSQFFKAVFLAVSILVVIASLSRYKNHPGQDEYYALLLFATVGMMVVASAIDLITLFVGFELASLSTYALAAFDKEKKNLEAAMKYFIFGAASSALLLFGFSLLYGMTGSTRIADIAAISMADFGPATLVALIFVIAGFAFKMALVPFHMWAPDTYEGSPTLVSALLAAGSKKMGFAAAFRIILVALMALRLEWYVAFAILAAVTMTLGNVVAVWQTNVRRMLAYSSVAQAGYIAIAFVVIGAVSGSTNPDATYISQLGLAGGLLQILGHALMKTGAFIAAGVVGYMVLREGKENPDDIENYAGLGQRAPITAFCMLIFLFALAGIPPTAGFVGKFVLFNAAYDAGLLWLVLLAILNSALSLYYYLRVIKYMYVYKPAGGRISEPKGYVLALLLATIAVVGIGVHPEPFIGWAMQAAAALLP
ncbi:MAG: NADH-quinone oxidoreductase subunit N [Methanosarcinales archaeon]|nr:NADH-quinone oxidoreductase subunit N [Methanosarcinales archaeon]